MLASFPAVEHAGQESTGVAGTEAPTTPSERNPVLGLDHARTTIAEWADDNNRSRPHSALGFITPEAYAANLTATDDRLRNPD